MKQLLVRSLLVAAACAFGVPALAGPANLPAAPNAHFPIAAANAVHLAGAMEQFRGRRFSVPFAWQREQLTMCRELSFFGSDVAKPLEVVYFARHGSLCGATPFYGFVLPR